MEPRSDSQPADSTAPSPPDQWEQTEDLFHEALELPADDRRGFLLDRCPDTTIRSEVERLLRAHVKSGEFLATSPASGRADVDQDLPQQEVGRLIGSYRIEEVIASGGMGTVYRAVRADDQFQKQVAIKLIRRDLASRELRRHFERERQALANLEHPYITRLLDGGTTDDGMPYLVMEFVQGSPIDTYCDSHRLTVVERIKLFRKVCSAVEHAHRNLVIHRDLKPANILVTEEGDPRVLDFGLSKLLDVSDDQAHRDQTIAVVRAWTPQYASPEQARGESCTTATDIYSLGVLLFEMLTGHRPYRFDNETPYQVERIVCEERCPTPSRAVTRVTRVPRSDGGTRTITPESISLTRGEPPARLRKRLRGDLDTIILKALQKDAHRRYLSVELLSQDLARHLAGQPVLARGDSMTYQASKFVRRHRWAVGGAAVVVVSLVAGMVLATAGLAREAEARRQADTEAARATQANEFLKEMLSSVDPGRDGRDVRVVDVLDQAAQRVEHAFDGQPEIESSLRETIGVAYRALGLYDASGPHLEAALRLARSAYDPNDRPVLEAMNELALLYWAQGHMDEALPLLKQALDAQRKQSGDEDPFTLTLNNNLAGLFMQRGQLAEAEPLFRRTIEIQRRTLGAHHADTLLTMSNLAMALRQQNQLDEALELFRLVYQERERTLGDRHPDTIVSINNLSAVLFSRGSYEEATELSRQVLNLQRSVNGPRHPHTLIAMSNLGALLTHAGDLDAAESLLTETLTLKMEVLGAEHPETLKTRHGIASVYRDQGRLDEAVSLAREVVEVAQRVLPDQHWRIARHRLLLAQLEIELDDLDGVEADLTSIHATLQAQLGAEHPSTLDAVATLVRYYEATDQSALADEYRSIMPAPDSSSE